MKLYLILISALLVPLVTAESLGKFLYSKEGDVDYLITESFNATSIYGEQFPMADGFIFGITSYHDGRFYRLFVNGKGFEENQSFAVEAFWNEKRTSDRSLKHLIFSNDWPMIIRYLTDEERSQLEAYKQKRKQTDETNFKVTRKGVYLKTESSKFSRLITACLPFLDKEHYLFQFEFRDPDYSISKTGLVNGTPDMSFVLERRPDRKDSDCEADKMPDSVSFKPYYCRGKLGIRALTSED